MAALKLARALARERAWLLRAEAGRPIPTLTCAGVDVPGLVIDFDASLVTCHSEKEGTAATFKHGFGYHPLLVWLDNTNEALAGMLRPGNAGSNTAADHIRVTDEALGQIPDAQLYGQPILVRSDGAGATKEWLTHLRNLRDRGVWMFSSRSGSASPTRSKTPSPYCPSQVWATADRHGREAPSGRRVGSAGRPGRRTDLAAARLHHGGWPEGMRVLVRRERPHPGAKTQLDGSPRRLALPMRGDRHPARPVAVPGGPAPGPRPGRGPGQSDQADRDGPLPVPGVRHQPGVAAAGVDRHRSDRLDPDHPPRRRLAAAEPKKLRYQIFHAAARIVRGQRKTRIRIDTSWPWATQLAAAFNRLDQIRPPLLV